MYVILMSPQTMRALMWPCVGGNAPTGGTVQKLRSRLPFSWWGFLMLFCVETTYILLMSCARFPEMVLRKSKRTPRKIPGSRKHVAEYGKS